jgi:hypothetical protein
MVLDTSFGACSHVLRKPLKTAFAGPELQPLTASKPYIIPRFPSLIPHAKSQNKPGLPETTPKLPITIGRGGRGAVYTCTSICMASFSLRPNP